MNKKRASTNACVVGTIITIPKLLNFLQKKKRIKMATLFVAAKPYQYLFIIINKIC